MSTFRLYRVTLTNIDSLPLAKGVSQRLLHVLNKRGVLTNMFDTRGFMVNFDARGGYGSRGELSIEDSAGKVVYLSNNLTVTDKIYKTWIRFDVRANTKEESISRTLDQVKEIGLDATPQKIHPRRTWGVYAR